MKPALAIRLSCVLALVAASLFARVADAQCPDTRASNVQPQVQDGTTGTHCQIAVLIFGLHIGFSGNFCPNMRFVYPAHQECQGSENAGTMCVLKDRMDVQRMKCVCVHQTVFRFLGLGVDWDACTCSDDGTAGQIQNYETVPCVGP